MTAPDRNHRYTGERNRSDDRCQACGREYADMIHDSHPAWPGPRSMACVDCGAPVQPDMVMPGNFVHVSGER